jgi:hypothetical protein
LVIEGRKKSKVIPLIYYFKGETFFDGISNPWLKIGSPDSGGTVKFTHKYIIVG